MLLDHEFTTNYNLAMTTPPASDLGVRIWPVTVPMQKEGVYKLYFPALLGAHCGSETIEDYHHLSSQISYSKLFPFGPSFSLRARAESMLLFSSTCYYLVVAA